MKKQISLALVLILFAVIWVFLGVSLPKLADLKANMEILASWRDRAPVFTALVFFITYVGIAALSLPLSSLMTLAVAALFGFAEGLVIVSFASTLGALIAFLAARYFLRDMIHARFSHRLAGMNDGIKRDGAFYLFTLRLIPVFPFFLVNLAMGLTLLRAWTFYWVSQLGMLAGTAVYVNAGTQLGKLESLSGILSPSLLASFALLGLLPWFGKAMIGVLRRRKIYSRFSRPKQFDRNLIVIGAGAAGLVSSYIAAAVKAKATLVEAHKMGGDCLNYGCVPSKALIKSAKLAHQIRHADLYGLQAIMPDLTFRAVMARVQRIIGNIAPHDSVERYSSLGVEVLAGYARIVDPWTVEITLADGAVQKLTTRAIVVATGAQPIVPTISGIEESGYVTSDSLWARFAELEQAPPRLVVLGGGPIGCELAQSFARLGSRVTQIEQGARLMVREDAEVSEFVNQSLEADGVLVLTGTRAIACEHDENGKFILVEKDGFGLDALGIPVGRTIATNAYLETLYPNILAAGDVAGPYQLTHVAAHQAWFASVNALFGTFKKFKVDYRLIPWTTFVDPEVARVGLNEQEAREKSIVFEVTRFELRELDRAITDGATQGFIKVLTVPNRDKILGVTIVGEQAGELLAEFVLAMKYGLGLNKILATIHTYPTFAEANKYVAGNWKRAHGCLMIDRYLLPLQTQILKPVARRLSRLGVTADQTTLVGFGCGVIGVVCLGFSWFYPALVSILLNRLLDGLDGAIARTGQPTQRGAFLDIALDFFFYALVPLGFAFADPQHNALPAATLIAAFAGTESSFLAFAVVAAKKGMSSTAFPQKGIYYLGGLAEGAETIAVFTAMCLLPNEFSVLAYGYALVCFITILTRWAQGWVAFGDE
eukprot:gene18555-18839_t